MTKHLSNENRQRVIDAYNRGLSLREIAAFFNFSKSAIGKIIQVYLAENRTIKIGSGGERKKSLREEHKLAIKNYISADCTITLNEIKIKLEADYNINVSIKTIDRTISNFNFSLKNIHLIPEKRNDVETIRKRNEYATTIFPILTETNGNNIFFIDEVGFNVVMRTRRGRSLVGTRATLNVPALRSKNISCCCAMSRNGIFYFETNDNAFNTNSFSVFLNNLISKFNEKNIVNATLIMDNVAFHKSELVQTIVQQAGHNIIFLPPYSPFLNPIENLFSKWKQMIRHSNSSNSDELMENIAASYIRISATDCEGYYRHMLSFLPLCLRNEIILIG